jgi:hypothetical protein
MEQRKRRPKKGPPKDLPDEMPQTCVIAIFVGAYCEEPGPRHLLLNTMFRDAKQKGKAGLEDWKNYVKENWVAEKTAYQAKRQDRETGENDQ